MMVDDLKKQMHRFENLIGFESELEVTSRKSMEELIDAFNSKYKEDLQNSLRLHRLHLFYDLVQSKRRKSERQEEESFSKEKNNQKSSSTKVKVEGEGKTINEDQQQINEEEVKSEISYEIVKVKAEDIDDWNDLMTLFRFYYVMEHPRSVGLTWKRRITKKTKIDTFENRDMIEWNVSQNFRLKTLEEWAQRRSDAHRLAELLEYDCEDSDESDEDSREMEELFEMFDPSGKRKSKKKYGEEKKKPTSDRSFKFCDESMEDWIESYSEDSEYSDIEDSMEEIEDFPDETDIEIDDLEKPESPTLTAEDDISEMLAVYPEFSRYKDPILREMDEAETFEEWLNLYKKAIKQFEEMKAEKQDVKFDEKLDMIIEEEEEEEGDKIVLKKEEVEEEKVIQSEKLEPKIEDIDDKAKEIDREIDEEQKDYSSEEEEEKMSIEKKDREISTEIKDTEPDAEEQAKSDSKESEKESEAEEKEREHDTGEKQRQQDTETKESEEDTGEKEDTEEEKKELVAETMDQMHKSEQQAPVIENGVESKEVLKETETKTLRSRESVDNQKESGVEHPDSSTSSENEEV